MATQSIRVQRVGAPLLAEAAHQTQPKVTATFIGDGLLGLCLVVALGMGLRARGDPFSWLLLAGLAVMGRCAVAPAFRQRLGAGVGRAWARLEAGAPGRLPLPLGAAFLFVGLPAAVVYLAEDRTMGSGDTLPVMMTAVSLAREGDVELSEYARGLPDERLPYYLTRTSSGILSKYPAGMNLFAAPVAALARLVGADLETAAAHLRLEKWTAAWVAAGSVTLFFLLAFHLVPVRPALVATGLVALGSAYYSTLGQGLWQHGGIVFWSSLMLLTEFRHARRPWGGSAVLIGLAAGQMAACRLSAAVFLVPFAVWLLARSPRRAAAAGAAAVVSFAPWAWFYLTHYGSVWGPTAYQLQAGNWTTALAEPLAGVLICPARGLLIYQPWLLLGLAALSRRFMRSVPTETEAQPPRWMWVCGLVIFLHVLMVSGWAMWWGGYCWGSRLLADTIPWLGLLCVRPVAALWANANGRRVVGLAAALGFLLHFVAVHFHADAWSRAVAVDEHPARLWDWADPPFFAGRIR
jgi:hypothetical protein